MEPRKRFKPHTAKEWESFRHDFTQLYLFEGKSLGDVVEVLRKKGFRANRNHCKVYLKKWGLSKVKKEHKKIRRQNNNKPEQRVSRVSYTISEDFTGDETSVKRARLAPLAKESARFSWANGELKGRLASLSDPATRKALGLDQRKGSVEKSPLSLVLRRDEKPSLNRLK